MKFIFALLFLSFTNKSFGQKENDFSSFKKYSYPVFSFKYTSPDIVNIGCGTGFLYKVKDKIFLISAYHVFVNMNPFSTPFNGTIPHYEDTLYLKYQKLNSNDFGIDTIFANERTLGKIKIFKIDEDIDMYGIELNHIPKDGEFNYINKFIDSNYFNRIPSEVCFYGYPDDHTNSKNLFYANEDSIKGYYNNSFNEWDSITKDKHPDFPELNRENLVNKFKGTYFFISKLASKGFSGSPVFGRYNKRKNRSVLKFTGLVFGGEHDLLKTWAIQSKIVNEYFKNNLQ